MLNVWNQGRVDDMQEYYPILQNNGGKVKQKIYTLNYCNKLLFFCMQQTSEQSLFSIISKTYVH